MAEHLLEGSHSSMWGLLKAGFNRFYRYYALILSACSSTTMLRRVTSEIDTMSTYVHAYVQYTMLCMYTRMYLVHYVQ